MVGGVVNTALVAVSRGDHGGGSKRSRRDQREGAKEKKLERSRLSVAVEGAVERDVDWTKIKFKSEES